MVSLLRISIEDQNIAAFGSSYTNSDVGAAEGCDLFWPHKSHKRDKRDKPITQKQIISLYFNSLMFWHKSR
jgi:hypothetical protein